MNVVRLYKDKIWTKTADVERLELGLLVDAEIENNVLLCSVGVFHLEPETYESEAEVKKAYDVIYPNGKPKPKPEPTKPTISESERISLLEEAMNAILGGA